MADLASGKSDTEKQINLAVLRKLDHDIDEIVDTASSVAHYKFNAGSGVWEKTDVEGSLFLYSRKTSPLVIIFIMNRLNKENTKLILTADMEFKVQEPFLLCKASNSEIIGIWFYDQQECQRFGSLLSRLSVLAKDEKSLKIALAMENKKGKPEQKLAVKQDGIMGMFSKANDEFKKSRGGKQASNQHQQKNKQNQKTNKQQGKPNLNKRSSEPNILQVKVPTEENLSPKSSRKLEIRRKQEEFQERHMKEEETLFNILKPGQPRMLTRTRTMSSSTEQEGLSHGHDRGYSSKAGDLAVLPESTFNDGKTKVIGCAELESTLWKNTKKENNSINTVQSSSNNILYTTKTERMAGTTSLPLNTNAAPTTTLLSPSVMTAKSGKGRGTTLGVIMNGQQKVALAANFNQGNKTSKKLFPDDEKAESKFPEPPSSSTLGSLMSPAAFQARSSSANAMSKIESENDILSKDQFQEALIHMIKNNDGFVNALHAAYMEVRQKR